MAVDVRVVELATRLTREKIGPRAARYDRDAANPVESWSDLWQAGLLAAAVHRATAAHAARHEAAVQIERRHQGGQHAEQLVGVDGDRGRDVAPFDQHARVGHDRSRHLRAADVDGEHAPRAHSSPRLTTLPVALRGSSSTNSMSRGTLNRARFCFT